WYFTCVYGAGDAKSELEERLTEGLYSSASDNPYITSDDVRAHIQSKEKNSDRRPRSVRAFQTTMALVAFLGAVLWLNLIANEVVAVLQSLGIMFKISTAILGLTGVFNRLRLVAEIYKIP